MNMRKKLPGILLALCLSLLLIPILAARAEAVDASGTCGDSVVWTLNNSGVLTITGSGNMSSGTPPWSDYRNSIYSVVIGSGVTSIGDYAFCGCSALDSVQIPDTVSSIGLSAFEGCISLESIAIPNNVTTIEMRTFVDCSRLKTVSLPQYVARIYQIAFWNCTSLKTITIPSTVKTMGHEVFRGCTALEYVYFRCSAPTIQDQDSSVPSTNTLLFGNGVRPTAYYPYDDASWTESARTSYSSGVTWVPYDYENNCIVYSAPVITVHPQSVTVTEGQTASFSVTATGINCQYQWQRRAGSSGSWSDLSGATSASYGVTATTGLNGYQYRCLVSNPGGSVASNAATLTVTPASYVVTITADNFPDANFRSIVSDNFDKNGDGYLTESEIAAVKEISVYDEGISSLIGIEYFTALEYLDCTGNDLSSVMMRYNTTLKELYCDDNQLLFVDVKGCTALTDLHCNINEMNDLDISGCTALEYLDCSNNYLSELDLSDCPELEELQCYGTWIDTLDISGCPNLVNLYLNGTRSEGTSGGVTYVQYKLNSKWFTVDKTTTLITGVQETLTITTQPTSKTVTAGTSVSFKVVATGATSYQWQLSSDGGTTWKNCSSTGYNTDTFTFTAGTAQNGRQYRCQVKNGSVTVTSSAAKLTVK